jgi:subtilase family serine protease
MFGSRRVVLRFAAALTAVSLAPLVATAQTSPATAASFSKPYAIAKNVCPPAKPGHAQCFAMRLVPATAGTPGARAYVPAAGAATIGPAGGLTPSDLATAYGFSSTATGTGQTVAIVDAYNDPTIEADLQTFDTQYGLALCTSVNGCFKKVGQTGSTTTLPPNDTTGWSIEIALDVETVHSVCQKCKVLLVEATDNSFANLATAVNEAHTLAATEISNSYGAPETGWSSTQAAAFNHPGTVIAASTGDDGYYSFDQKVSTNMPSGPASFSTVLAVGGTSLYLNQNATRSYETVWDSAGPADQYQRFYGIRGATGGGCSTVTTAPGWQTALSVWASTVCGTKRLPADVSALADPFTGFDIYNSNTTCGSSCPTGWNTFGGTSLASPLVTAMFGLAGGAAGINYPALTLYGHLGTSALYDVTIGGNGYCGGEGAPQCGNPNALGSGVLDCDYPASGSTPSAGTRACDAAVGYDGPTGVGTPIGLTALQRINPVARITAPASITHNVAANFSGATSSDPFPGGHIVSYKWTWGDGTTTTTASATTSHTYTSAGSKTVTLTVTDNYGVVSAAASKVVTVS